MNSGEVIELYERYRQNPDSVDEKTRSIFDHWQPPEDSDWTRQPSQVSSQSDLEKVVTTLLLAQSIRTFEYLDVKVDPLVFPTTR